LQADDLVKISVNVETTNSRSARARQAEAFFDVPSTPTSKLSWEGDAPIEDQKWNIGLIVGPSGSGKTTIAKSMFKENFHPRLEYDKACALDDVREGISVADIAAAFGAVGFNTIPAWLRPYAVLSTGEQFRVDVARRILELPDPIVIDEFTSVVDRQVAKIASHAIQKLVRRQDRKLVCVTCHHDVEDWLQPDWVIEPASMSFRWRSLRRRPTIDVEIGRCSYDLWKEFAPYHYLTADLNRNATCFAARVNGRAVAFTGMINFPHPTAKNIVRVSRVVTLPDYQGVGLAFALIDTVGSMYRAIGKELRNYPAHFSFVRSHARSKNWEQTKRHGDFQNSTRRSANSSISDLGGSRPCATFRYVGPTADDKEFARRFVSEL
jgi:GNAT superfamily N-acetyltransferase